ncbi:sensor histidine kinase [Spongiivirga citrea]|uniref:histidine kinase n=1 Tax=Spongiivirga citrea TaxID=1481457 RepID=A0A6M0CUY7_9FLAO|nr:HAMP domain-containing sensor histidine kinase [Spongiivirga citrea]NER17600.1 GHKL domain-containing protein [Spongiivirga citrea]
MNKRLFVVLVILMSLSLIGIIFVQGYWIKTSVDDKEEQFSMNINQILVNVSREIKENDFNRFMDRALAEKDTTNPGRVLERFRLYYQTENPQTNETFIYQHGILEEDYGFSSSFFEDGLDSIQLKNYISREYGIVLGENPDSNLKNLSTEEWINRVSEFDELQRLTMLKAYDEVGNKQPVHKRVSNKELELALNDELRKNDIDIEYEYAVYGGGLPTKVRSDGFKIDNLRQYDIELFPNNNGLDNFQLFVNFPKRKSYILSSILGMAVLSVVFTLIIVIAYSSALYQLVKQKQISEIKTDFINNMTHEFKTPIATINLALDAIKNPKTMGDEERMKIYLKMIKDENKRMHAQVENVLRISRLEKNQLDISKDRVSMHDLVEEAVTHVSLIVEDRGGFINTHLEAKRDDVVASQMHFTNVIVNMLDNAIKYSPDGPKIDVYTENVGNYIIVKIQDQGMGMSKVVLKKIFEKFYRETTGNIHNVKGHGLGLAYVKKIVDDHQGEVYAESEKDKGSTFYIKLPLI